LLFELENFVFHEHCTREAQLIPKKSRKPQHLKIMHSIAAFSQDNMEYEELLKVVGEFGPFQLMVFVVTSIMVIQTACNNLGMVFLGAKPDHFCHIPALDHLNLTWDVLRNATIPHNGESYSKCEMYKRNYTDWTMLDVDEALLSNKDDLEKVACTNGWNYDDSIYKSSIVTQVNFSFTCMSINPT
jgi:hypothetical protein